MLRERVAFIHTGSFDRPLVETCSSTIESMKTKNSLPIFHTVSIVSVLRSLLRSDWSAFGGKLNQRGERKQKRFGNTDRHSKYATTSTDFHAHLCDTASLRRDLVERGRTRRESMVGMEEDTREGGIIARYVT